MGPSRLELGHTGLDSASVSALLTVLLGRSSLLVAPPGYPPPPLPNLDGLVHLSLAGSDLSSDPGLPPLLQEVLSRARRLQVLDVSSAKLEWWGLPGLATGLMESGAPLAVLDVRDNRGLLTAPTTTTSSSKGGSEQAPPGPTALAQLLASKKKTLLSLSLQGVYVDGAALSVLLGGLPEGLPDLFLDLSAAKILAPPADTKPSPFQPITAALATGRLESPPPPPPLGPQD